MDSKIRAFWDSNKLVFFILLPILLIIVFKDVLISILAGSLRKTSEAAKKEDALLKQQEEQAKLEAESKMREAKDLEDKIASRKAEEVTENWNKKK